MLSEEVIKQYGHQLRTRVTGILQERDTLLMVKHVGFGELGFLWSPPGGGMEYGLSAPENLKREFLEETGLEVEVKDFLFACELLKPPFHAIELFFEVKATGGELIVGKDPEMKDEHQIIKQVDYMTIAEIAGHPPKGMHKAFHNIEHIEEVLRRKGYYQI